MRKILYFIMAILVVFGLFTLTGISRSDAVSFTPLGDLPGGSFQSFAFDVSGDGTVVVGVGKNSDSSNEAFRWTSGGGMVGLGDLSGGIDWSSAAGVSGDGSVVVGTGFGSNLDEAFRWTSSGGMVGLGFLSGGTHDSFAKDVSANDGSVVVGTSRSTGSIGEAFRWTSGGGMVGLGFLGGSSTSDAVGVSADGTVIVGSSNNEAFRWTSGGGMVGLGFMGGSSSSSASGVSADGTVVVGSSNNEAFRWTSGGGMVGLGDLAGGQDFSLADSVSGNGSVVVGRSVSASGMEVFIWDSVNEIRNLKDVLISEGVSNLTGWTLERAYGISDDGLTIVGAGTNSSGDTEAWMISLETEPVPEPATFALLGIGLAGFAGVEVRRRRKKRVLDKAPVNID